MGELEGGQSQEWKERLREAELREHPCGSEPTHIYWAPTACPCLALEDTVSLGCWGGMDGGMECGGLEAFS